MRSLEKITVEKDSEGYHVYLHWKNKFFFYTNKFVFQTGETCKRKKDAIRIAKDWINSKEWMENQKLFKFNVSDYIDLTRTTGRTREMKGETK